jgi:predicted transcriptional regulator
MILPQEIEVFYVIPAIRRELAKDLFSKGFKQKQIANIFGVTAACVNNYFKEKRGKNVKFSPEIKEIINKCADNIATGKSCFINSVQQICKEFKNKKCLCKLHEKLDPHVCKCRGCLS